MNPRRILIALGLALFVSGVSTWYASKRMAMPPPPVKMTNLQYAAPASALEAGEVVGANNAELVAWPSTFQMDGAFQHVSEVAGRTVMFPLAKGQPILERDLTAAGTGLGLASRIPNGLRAVTLHSDEVVGVAGFLLPGSHLDVLATYRSQSASEPVTATVLQNVVVVAAGHQMEPDPSGKTADVTVVTLLLTPDEAERAVLASAEGAIHFVLRNGGDVGVDSTMPIQLSQLTNRQLAVEHVRTAPVSVATPIATVAKRHEIEMVYGGSGEIRPAVAPEGGRNQ